MKYVYSTIIVKLKSHQQALFWKKKMCIISLSSRHKLKNINHNKKCLQLSIFGHDVS